MSDETKSWIGAIVIIVLVVVAFFGVIGFGAYKMQQFQCRKLSSTTGIQTKYSFWGGGCLVRVNDRFIPKENWRGEYEQEDK